VAQWPVHRGSSLEHFLRGKNVQQWKIPALIAAGAVQVIRGSTAIPLRGPRTHVDQFDVVKLVDPLPPAAIKALQDEADKACRDYALATGKTPYDDAMRGLLAARPETILVKDPALFELSRFFAGLMTNPVATNPIRHILVGGHANAEGALRLQIDGIVDRGVNYNDLLNLIKSRAVVIDIKMLLPRPNDARKVPIQAKFIVRGCHIGHQVKFIDKLRGALGGLVPVAAPIHYHLVTPTRRPPGFMEYLGYAFELSSPTKLKDRKAVIAAMVGAAFPRIDGKPVPAKFWNEPKVIPKDPHKLDRGKTDEGEQRAVAYARSPVDNKKTGLPRIYRYKLRKLFKDDNAVGVPGKSTKATDRVKAVRDDLVKRGWFQEKSDFPVYERFGYKSIDEFMAAWDWRFKPKAAADKVTYNAYRHEYRLVEPIAELQSGKTAKVGQFILNYFSTSKRHKPVTTLMHEDPRLYLTR
jgi:hypothetical protein